MATFACEKEPGTSAEIDTCRLDTTGCIADIDMRSNQGRVWLLFYRHLPCSRPLIAFSFQSARGYALVNERALSVAWRRKVQRYQQRLAS
jgi:hypothetical protein